MASSDKQEDEIQRGKIFTDAQRDYLRTGSASSKNYESTLETRIRQRVIGVLEDLQLFGELSKGDRQKIFESNKQMGREGVEYNHTEYGTLPQIDKELSLQEGPIGIGIAFDSVFKFYYKIMRENGYSPGKVCGNVATNLEKAEQEVLAEKNPGRYHVEATVNIDGHKKVDIEDAKQRYKEDGLHGVSNQELYALEEAGHFTLKENPE